MKERRKLHSVCQFIKANVVPVDQIEAFVGVQVMAY